MMIFILMVAVLASEPGNQRTDWQLWGGLKVSHVAAELPESPAPFNL